MSGNMCKLRRKLRNGQNLPCGSPNFSYNFFVSYFTVNLGHFATNLRPYYQNSFFLNFFCLFSTLSSSMSKNKCKLRRKLQNAKKCVGQTCTWSNEA